MPGSLQTVWICDAVRTPFARYGGALARVRADELAALPIQALMARQPQIDWRELDEVSLGCANQAGEDSRNVARIASLLAGLPETVAAQTINRLCGSSLDAIGSSARAIRCAEAQLIIAGGVESMTRAPLVMAKPDGAYARNQQIEDTTIGWRFVNPRFAAQFGIDSMAQTAENLAAEMAISRADQDAYALHSQQRYAAAAERGFFEREIIAVETVDAKQQAYHFARDEHPRPQTSLADLTRLKPITSATGTITAGNASGLNDGAAAVLLANSAMLDRFQLQPRARILGMATAGVAPRVMGIGPVSAIHKVLALTQLTLAQIDVIELNEAFAAQVLAVSRSLGLADDDQRLNPNGGAIAIGHPLGASGARLVATALAQLEQQQGRYALCSMCIGVGQGIAVIIERV